jgi:aminotransferase
MSTVIKLDKNASMRDVGDFCNKNGIPSLAQGMIELPPPLKLRELAAFYATADDVHMYRDRFGEKVFLDAIVSLLAKHYGINVEKKNLMAVQGVTAGCVTTLTMLKNEGRNRIGLVSPYYTYHLKEVHTVFGKDPVYIPMFNYDDLMGEFDFGALEKALQDGLDCVIICNPSNPVGKIWKKDDILKVVTMCEKHNCFLLLDECYCDMVWEPHKLFTPLPPHTDKFYENVIICRGFSKVLGCQSWRAGYVIAHESLIPKMMLVHDPVYVCVPFIQHALGDFLSKHYDVFQAHCQQIGELMQSNWKKLSVAFKEHLGWEPIDPQGSMYGMFKHNHETDMDGVLVALERGVGVVPCSIFWPNLPAKTGYIRIHCGVISSKADLIVQKMQESAKKEQ